MTAQTGVLRTRTLSSERLRLHSTLGLETFSRSLVRSRALLANYSQVTIPPLKEVTLDRRATILMVERQLSALAKAIASRQLPLQESREKDTSTMTPTKKTCCRWSEPGIQMLFSHPNWSSRSSRRYKTKIMASWGHTASSWPTRIWRASKPESSTRFLAGSVAVVETLLIWPKVLRKGHRQWQLLGSIVVLTTCRGWAEEALEVKGSNNSIFSTTRWGPRCTDEA